MLTGYKRNLLSIAIPIMLNSLVSQLQMLIDRVFLGRLGVMYVSAVGNATAPMWTTMTVLFAMTTGATILISQAMGANDNAKAQRFTAAMFKYNNAFAVLLFLFWLLCSRKVYLAMGVSSEVIEACVTYTFFYTPIFIVTGISASLGALLQTCGDTKPLVLSGAIRSGLNILLDWLLIFGHCGFPKMGIAGAAIATMIAEFVGLALILPMIVRNKKLTIKPRFMEIITAKFAPYKEAVKMGIPAVAEEFSWNFGNLMIIRILNSIDAYAAGVFTIVFSIEIIPVVIVNSLGNATLTLTGKETGRRDFVQAKKIGRTAFLWCMGVAVVSLCFFMLFPRQLMGLFTKETAILASAGTYLLIVGMNLFPKSGNMVLGSGIRGYGDTRWMMFTQFFGTVFVIVAALCCVFVFKLGISGVFIAVILDETVRCIINSVRFRRGATEPVAAIAE